MFKTICALLKRKIIEPKLPAFPIKNTDFFDIERPKKPKIKKATTRIVITKKTTPKNVVTKVAKPSKKK